MSGSLPGIKHIIATSSGKGGVGKSTVSVNLALALSQMGYKVGLADVDIYGPSIPGMLGLEDEQPLALGQQLVPIECHGLKVMSMGFLIGQDTPSILRGPMITKFIHQFVMGVHWGELDFLLLDMPPGTGDAQLSLAQTVPLAGALVVTTPQAVSVKVALRGLRMFEKVKVPILGVIENMSGWACPACGHVAGLFQSDGGKYLSEHTHVPFLGGIPIDPAIASGGDQGQPVMVAHPTSASAQAYRRLAENLVQHLNEKPVGSGLGSFTWTLNNGEGAPAWNEYLVDAEKGRATLSVGLHREGNLLQFLWQDGKKLALDDRGLRLACPCAMCVDENTGKKLLVPSMVPMDVQPMVIETVGAYALRISWSDGHGTGLYSFETLRRLGEERAAALSQT